MQLARITPCHHLKLLQIAHMCLEELAKRHTPHQCRPVQLKHQELVLVVGQTRPSRSLVQRVVARDILRSVIRRVPRRPGNPVLELHKISPAIRNYIKGLFKTVALIVQLYSSSAQTPSILSLRAGAKQPEQRPKITKLKGIEGANHMLKDFLHSIY